MKHVPVVAVFLLVSPTLLVAEEPANEAYAPGLGEFMAMTQIRHAKLWFAGEAKNWDLAHYEIDEIKEGLDDAAKLHPTHEGVPVADMIKANIHAPLDELTKAADAKSRSDFTVAFDKLTSACNTCHAAAQHGYIKIQRPRSPPLSNQIFGLE